MLGLSPLPAGLWETPFFAAFLLGSALASPLAARVGRPRAVSGGLALCAAGSAVVALVGVGGGLPAVVAGAAVVALGLSPVVTLVTDLVVGAAPAERAGAAASVSETGTELGGALGVALLGSVAVAVYRLGVDVCRAGRRPPRTTRSAGRWRSPARCPGRRPRRW